MVGLKNTDKIPISNASLQQNLKNLTTFIKESVVELKNDNTSTKTELTEKIDGLSAKFDQINYKLGSRNALRN